MKRLNLKRSLITLGLLTLVGTVGAEMYYTHKVAEEVQADGNRVQVGQQAPDVAGHEVALGFTEGNPWTEVRRIEQPIDRRFEEIGQRMHAEIAALKPLGAMPHAPELTLKDEEGDYVVTARLPGIHQGDLDVFLDGRLLRISAQSAGQAQETAQNGHIVRDEAYANSLQ